MKIIDLYKSILSTAGLKVDKDDMVSATAGDVSIPFVVKGKRLVLPTKSHLSNPNKDSIAIFHPLSENTLRGESDVMGRFRSAINTRMNYVVGCIAQELMTIATSVKMHSQLNPDQQELLSKLKNADEKTLSSLQSILKAMSLDSKDKNFVHIFLKRGGIVAGKKYSRAAIVTFPLYEELCKSDKAVYGVTLRTKDKQSLIALLEFIFSDIQTPNTYDRGSYSDIAPFLDSLMLAVKSLASDINTVIDGYEQFIPDALSYKYEDEWVETFDNLSQLLGEIRSIPMQAGNEGEVVGRSDTNTQQAVGLITPTAAPVQQTHVPQNPHNFNAPIMQPMQQPQVYQQPVQNGPVRTEGGIDFSASTRNNPAFQQFNPMMPGQMVQQVVSVPRWAQPQAPMFGQMPMGAPMMMGGGYMPGRI
jgi:hypothetical protein